MSGFVIDNPNLIRLYGVRNRRTGETISDAIITATVCAVVDKRDVSTLSIEGDGSCIVTTSGHGLTTGDEIYVAHCVGAKECNGAHAVTVLDANRFTLDGVEPSTPYIQDGIWYPALAGLFAAELTPQGAGVYTLTTSRAVNFVAGDSYILFADCDEAGHEFRIEYTTKASHRTVNGLGA